MNFEWYRKQLRRGRLLIRGTINEENPLETCQLRFLYTVDFRQRDGLRLVSASYRYKAGLRVQTDQVLRTASAEADELMIKEFLDRDEHAYMVIKDPRGKRVEASSPGVMVHFGYVLAAARIRHGFRDDCVTSPAVRALMTKLEGTVKHLPRK